MAFSEKARRRYHGALLINGSHDANRGPGAGIPMEWIDGRDCIIPTYTFHAFLTFFFTFGVPPYMNKQDSAAICYDKNKGTILKTQVTFWTFYHSHSRSTS